MKRPEAVNGKDPSGQGQRICRIRAKVAAGKANAFDLGKGICGNIRLSCPHPHGFASVTFPNALALSKRIVCNYMILCTFEWTLMISAFSEQVIGLTRAGI